jgi:hypothetical protein
MQDPELRCRSHVGLNKSEQQNALRLLRTGSSEFAMAASVRIFRFRVFCSLWQ